MKLSKHFSMNEAVRSDKAEKLRIANIPNDDQLENINYTATRLEPVREFLGIPMFILSWFRSEKLNKAVGGVPNSFHKRGLAIDFYTRENMETIYEKIKKSDLKYDQLIFYRHHNFIHIGFNSDESAERRQAFIDERK